MSETGREQIKKKNGKRRRAVSVWTPEEFLSRTSWYRFGPHSPKRQAHEIIKQLLAEVEALKCARPAPLALVAKSWAQKVKR